MQAQLFTGSASRIYLLLLAEFGGKGDRQKNGLDPIKILIVRLAVGLR